MMDELHNLVYAEHPCKDNHCDIGLANELGYSLVAAERLASACDWEVPADLWDEETFLSQDREFRAMYLLYGHDCVCGSIVYNEELRPRWDMRCDNCWQQVDVMPIEDRVERVQKVRSTEADHVIATFMRPIIWAVQDEADLLCQQNVLEEEEDFIKKIIDLTWEHGRDETFVEQLSDLLNISYDGVMA